MSYTEYHIGTATVAPIPKNREVHQYLKELLIEYGHSSSDWEGWEIEDYFNSEMAENDFYFHPKSNTLFHYQDNEADEENYIEAILENGKIKYQLSFYNGGAGFTECLDEALNKLHDKVKEFKPVNRTIEYRIINDGAGSVNIYFYNKIGLCEFMEELNHEYGNDELSMGEPTCDSFKCDNFEGIIHSATECYFDVLEILDDVDIEYAEKHNIINDFKEGFLPERPVIKQGVRDGWLVLEGVDTYVGLSLQEAEEKLDLYYPKN